LLRYGVFLYRAGRLEEAERTLRSAAAIEPVLPEVHAEWGRVLYQQGKLVEAAQLLERSAQRVEWAGPLLEKVRRQLAAREEP
jgi:Tfp pilus assembly protein PilF